MNGKGDRDRTIDKKQYDNCPLWNNWQTKRKNQDIWDAGKEEAAKMGIVTVEAKNEIDR